MGRSVDGIHTTSIRVESPSQDLVVNAPKIVLYVLLMCWLTVFSSTRIRHNWKAHPI